MNIGQVIRDYKTALTIYVAGIVKNPLEVDDLVMEIFEKAYYGTFEPRYKFSTWLYAIARNHCFDYLRKRRLPVKYVDEFNDDYIIHSPEDIIITSEKMKLIYESIDRLEHKSILRLHLDGFKNEDIAELIGVSNAQMRQYLFRAKKQLKQLL